MKDWIPLFQSLVWPVFIVLVVLFIFVFFGQQAMTIIKTIAKQVAEGGIAELRAGPVALLLQKLPIREERPELAAKQEIFEALKPYPDAQAVIKKLGGAPSVGWWSSTQRSMIASPIIGSLMFTGPRLSQGKFTKSSSSSFVTKGLAKGPRRLSRLPRSRMLWIPRSSR